MPLRRSLRSSFRLAVATTVAGLSATLQAGNMPTSCNGPCTPNVATFGYYPTQWRRWPEVGQPPRSGAGPMIPLGPIETPPRGAEERQPGQMRSLPTAEPTPMTPTMEDLPTTPAETPEQPMSRYQRAPAGRPGYLPTAVRDPLVRRNPMRANSVSPMASQLPQYAAPLPQVTSSPPQSPGYMQHQATYGQPNMPGRQYAAPSTQTVMPVQPTAVSQNTSQPFGAAHTQPPAAYATQNYPQPIANQIPSSGYAVLPPINAAEPPVNPSTEQPAFAESQYTQPTPTAASEIVGSGGLDSNRPAIVPYSDTPATAASMSPQMVPPHVVAGRTPVVFDQASLPSIDGPDDAATAEGGISGGSSGASQPAVVNNPFATMAEATASQEPAAMQPAQLSQEPGVSPDLFQAAAHSRLLPAKPTASVADGRTSLRRINPLRAITRNDETSGVVPAARWTPDGDLPVSSRRNPLRTGR